MKKILALFFCASLFLVVTNIQAQTSPEPAFPLSPKENQTIIIKLKEGVSPEILNDAWPLTKKPLHSKQTTLRQAQSDPLSIKRKHPDNLQSSFGLDRIYAIEINNGTDIEALLQALEIEAFIEYAETPSQMQLLYVPNDPLADPNERFQDNLSVIKAYEAWEIERGDSTMIIGILDTGVNMNHEDLRDNIYRNPADPINGFDDDGDGFIDNYMGWDFAYNDNNPNDTNGHGTQVAGIAAATTNNGIGIAGIGFNTKFMPLRVFDDEDTFIGGYEAILHAAKKGCKVINLSWGNAGEYSRYAEDIINTVVLDMDVVVVAAAGNSNKNEEYYPASYEYVLSVGNTTKADQKAGGSTFSPYIDIAAPGFDITTTSGNAYGPSFGTSMASPTVAGAAALVRARYPELNALQVMERLRATADDIYHIGNNHLYKEHLGKGRLNILKALIDPSATSVRFREIQYFNALGPYAFSGDTVTISGRFVNYLKTAENLTVTLSTNSPYIDLIDSTFKTNALYTLEAHEASFRVYLKPNLPIEEKIRFRLGYSGNGYEDYQYFDIESNPGHFTIDNGYLSMTIGDNGHLGYDTDPHTKGNGIVYMDANNATPLLKYVSLLLSQNKGSVLDNMYNDYFPPIREKDFKVTNPLRIIEDDEVYLKVASTFTDKATLSHEGFSIAQSLSAFKTSGVNQCLFLDYEITNNNPYSIDTLRMGLYTDWDIVEINHNKANYDFNYRLAYAFHPESQIYAGIALLSPQHAVYQSIPLYDAQNNFIFGNTISEEEKLSLLFKDDERLETGPANIATTLTAIQYNLEAQEKATISYAITAGKSLEELQKNISKALLIKEPFTHLPPISFCPEEDVLINPGLGTVYFYADSLFTQPLGEGTSLSIQASDDFVLYMKKEKGWSAEKYSLPVQLAQLEAYFELDEPEVALAHNVATIRPYNKSTCESHWEWYINDAIVSYSAEPILQFEMGGNYIIKLKVSNDMGISHTFSRSLYVDNITGIAGSSALGTIEVYPNPVTGILNINLPIGKHATVILTDQAGRTLLKKQTVALEEPYTMDVHAIRPGWYILQIRTNGQVFVQKVLIG